ncbi:MULTISPECIES: dihydrolipoamide acetyltransferase family protein [Oceanobacillus]|uniref:dihydrolipoamide acetyltransferase family protein n=1 Tax=Oceanobacillus TaxID=182709 RepID=UPI000693FE5D|nr:MULTISPECIES: dihydrolipoamide acetyltransferase family protein [Oceanobacillus]
MKKGINSFMLGTEETRKQLSPVRKVITKTVTGSKHTIPHATLIDEVDVTELMAHRRKYKNVAAEKGIKLTYLPYVVKALLSTAQKYPILNASIDDVSEEIIYKHYYNTRIAADTEDGLMVPVVKDVDRKSIFEISSEINELAVKARNRKLLPDETKDGTIMITNLGSVGGQWFTPVIYQPEVAALGIGGIKDKPVYREGKLDIVPMLALSLSFDHRLIDGVPAQHILNRVKLLLTNPERLVVEV